MGLAGKKIGLFGNKDSLGQPFVKEFLSSLNAFQHEVVLLPSSKILQSLPRWKEIAFDWMIFVDFANPTVDANEWVQVFSQLEQKPLMASWTSENLSNELKSQLKPDFEFIGQNSRSEILERLGLKGEVEVKSEQFLSDVDLNLAELSQKVSQEGETGLHTTAFLDDPSSLRLMPIDSSGSFETEHSPLEPSLGVSFEANADVLIEENSTPEGKEEVSLAGLSQASEVFGEEAMFMNAINEELEKSSVELSSDEVEKNKNPIDENLLLPHKDSELLFQSKVLEAPSKFTSTKVESPLHDLWAEESNIHEPQASMKSLKATELVAGIEEKNNEAEKVSIMLDSNEAYGVGASDDLKTMKRYAALKEREAREKSAALKALKNEFVKMQSKLDASEAERRRLSLSTDDFQVQLRTAKDKAEEIKYQSSKVEQDFQEQIKDLKIRLESAQFQVAKSERKLDEFRDRVRNDIQRIRVRERELANRLELQKRDAEALLGVKDERLLQQKREIDRLQFEIETLRERLEEEVNRADERTKKLTRAIQSLKLAQGMLSGLEHLDSSDSTSSNSDGEAA